MTIKVEPTHKVLGGSWSWNKKTHVVVHPQDSIPALPVAITWVPDEPVHLP